VNGCTHVRMFVCVCVCVCNKLPAERKGGRERTACVREIMLSEYYGF